MSRLLKSVLREEYGVAALDHGSYDCGQQFVKALFGEFESYSGSKEGCTFKPPYLAALRMRGGTNSPNDTAIIKLMGPFGVIGGYTVSEMHVFRALISYRPAFESIDFMDRE